MQKQVVKAGLLSSIIFIWVDGNLFYNSMKDLDTIFWDFDGATEQGWHFAEGAEEANPEGTLRIQINAHQWAWDARYAGPDGVFQTKDDIVSLNDIRVPENKTVYLQVASTDVIRLCAASLPVQRIDAMPGMINHLLVYTAEESEGEYEVVCAQHCGAAHYLMKAIWTVHSQQDFDTWAAESSHRSALPTMGPISTLIGAGPGRELRHEFWRTSRARRRVPASFKPIHEAPESFWKRYIFSTDHKVIMKQFLWAGIVIFLAIGGLKPCLFAGSGPTPARPYPSWER